MHLLGATLTLLLATSAAATKPLVLKPRDANAAPKVLQQDIQRRHIANPLARDQERLRRRATKTVNVVLDNEETLYFANVSIGTPAQNFRLHIDTGSSDIWVNTASSRLCSRRGSYCTQAGVYAPNSSSTYKYLNSLFYIQYADGSGASGDYVTDTVKIGDTSVTSQQFAIGYSSNSYQGVFGIGYTTNEAILSVRGGRQYNNLPVSLVSQGYINVPAYSLWLNDLDASTGSILFGGVNTGKYVGSLQSLPILPTSSGVYAAFYIALTGVGINAVDTIMSSSSSSVAVLLDSGASLTYLPNATTSAIYKNFGISYDSDLGGAQINCNKAYDSTHLIFSFSGVNINVSMSELVLNLGQDQTGADVCILGISPMTSTSNAVLGDTFLRSAYVVYDLSNNQIALANTNFNSTEDNILEITESTSTSNGIPDATGVANAVTSVGVSSGNDAILGGGSGSGSGSASTTSSSKGVAAPTQAPDMLGSLAALAMGAVMAGL